MELELRDHIYKQIFSQVATLHTVNSPLLITRTTKVYNGKPAELFQYQDRPTLPTDSTFTECRVCFMLKWYQVRCIGVALHVQI